MALEYSELNFFNEAKEIDYFFNVRKYSLLDENDKEKVRSLLKEIDAIRALLASYPKREDPIKRLNERIVEFESNNIKIPINKLLPAFLLYELEKQDRQEDKEKLRLEYKMQRKYVKMYGIIGEKYLETLYNERSAITRKAYENTLFLDEIRNFIIQRNNKEA